MAFEYAKLRGKIREVFNSQAAFAAAMHISTTTLSNKLNGKIDFSQSEIHQAIDLLGLSQVDVTAYFFTPKVQKL